MVKRGGHIDRQTREQPRIESSAGQRFIRQFRFSRSPQRTRCVRDTDTYRQHMYAPTHTHILQTDTHPHSRGCCYHDSLSAIRTTQRGINELRVYTLCVMAVQGMRCRLSLHLSPDFGHIDRLFGFDSDSLAGDQ